MIKLLGMNEETTATETLLVNESEISCVTAYHYHSFRPPCGSVIRMPEQRGAFMLAARSQTFAAKASPERLGAAAALLAWKSRPSHAIDAAPDEKPVEVVA